MFIIQILIGFTISCLIPLIGIRQRKSLAIAGACLLLAVIAAIPLVYHGWTTTPYSHSPEWEWIVRGIFALLGWLVGTFVGMLSIYKPTPKP